MTLRETVTAMFTRRDELCAELKAIDADLAECRSLLFVTPPPPAVPRQLPPPPPAPPVAAAPPQSADHLPERQSVPTEAPPLRGKLVKPLAERRCSRCLHKFTPTSDREFICPDCVDKPKPRPAEADPEVETAWRPGRDAPSLTGPTAGLGTSLSSESPNRASRPR